MDERKAETVRRLLESWGWPDWGPDLVTDDFVMEQHGGTMEGVYSGEPGMREYAKGFGEAWSEAAVEIEELIEHDELVVAMTRLRVRGISSGIEVAIAGAGIVRFAPDGRVSRIDAYTERDAARAALGLG